MKYFKDAAGKPYGLEDDGSQDYLIDKLGLEEIDEVELAALLTPTLTPLTKDQRIAAKLAVRGLTLESEWQLYAAIAGMQAAAATQGKTEAQLYASNIGYKNAKDLFVEIATIRAGA